MILKPVLEGVVLVVRAVLTYFRPITDVLLDVFCYIFYGGTEPLPFIDNGILLMPATELAKKIRKRELSAVEVMQAYVSRIKAVHPILNSCVDERFQDALADAKAVDKLIDTEIKTEEDLAETLPLLGVPFTCKEIIGVKGMTQSWGLQRFKNRKALDDADVVTQYKKAGAIPVVVTNVPVMSAWWDTANRAFGTTKNPYNNTRSVGGSSGGEASLISSAGAVIGIGNDMAGSIRIPASFCGIYAHKPSKGIISNKTTYPDFGKVPELIKKLDPFISTGPMCRYAEDLIPLVKVLAGEDSKKLRLNEKVDFRNIKVYYIEEFPGSLLSATHDVKSAVRKAVKHFEDEYGVSATELKIPELKYAMGIWQSKLFEAGGVFRTAVPEISGPIQEIWVFIRTLLGFHEFDLRILYHSAIEFEREDKFYKKCLAMSKVIEKKLADALDGNAILIVPSHPEPPPHSITTIPKFKNVGYTCIFNLYGMPGSSVPSGQSKGVPIGLQVLAKQYNDRLTLAAAVELNKVFGGWKNPSPVLV